MHAYICMSGVVCLVYIFISIFSFMNVYVCVFCAYEACIQDDCFAVRVFVRSDQGYREAMTD